MHDSNFLNDQPPDESVQGNNISQAGLLLSSPGINSEILDLLFQLQANPLNQSNEALITHGTWSHQEDELLIHAVEQLGPKKWIDIAKFIPTRTSKQCRERWFNRLAPNLNRGPFQPWEDKIILQKQKEVGNRWSLIAKALPGRSPNSIKNRWYSGLKSQNEVSSEVTINPNDFTSQPELIVNQMCNDIPIMNAMDQEGHQDL